MVGNSYDFFSWIYNFIFDSYILVKNVHINYMLDLLALLLADGDLLSDLRDDVADLGLYKV